MKPESGAGTSSGLGKGRIEALSDGVFAIAMTLLVLDLKPPTVEPGGGRWELLAKLVSLWPRGLTYVISFLVLGGNWVAQHSQLHYVRHSNRTYLWMNLLYLMLISAVPFSAGVLGQSPSEPVAITLYSVNLTLAGCVLYAQLWYAAGPGRLFVPDIDPKLVLWGGRRIMMGPALYVLATLVSFVRPSLGFSVCVVTPLLYMIPGRVDRYWRQGHRTTT